MKYYNENTGQELTRSGVRKAVSPTTLPKNFEPEHVVGWGFIPIVEITKPEINDLQRIENGGVELVLNKYHRIWNIVDKFQDIPGGLTKEEQESEFLSQQLIDERIKIQNSNKKSCESFILSEYPEPIQRSAALGVYPQATIDTMVDQIARCIVEENRVFDLLESATTIDELQVIETPVWTEVWCDS